MTNSPPETPSGDDDAENPGVHEAARREKLRKIQELGVDPWGQRFDGHQKIDGIRARESEIVVAAAAGVDNTSPEQHGPKVRAAGRIILQRKKGKLIFADIRDWSDRIQVLIGRKQVGEENWALAECLDLGDLIGVDGELKKTKTGELTIFAEKLHFLTKSVLPHPEKHHGLASPELRQRMRYLDLVHTEGAMKRFLNRTKIVQSIRKTLGEDGFVEIEGPTLHSIAGGAAARPFKTHHNALDMPLFLRIALELHLKRLLVGGIERVYELGRVYRNEGISPRHNPEFTMLEVYQAYGDYGSMMDLTEKLVDDAIRATDQPLQLPWGETTIDFTRPFDRRTYGELFLEHVGCDMTDEDAVCAMAKEHDIDVIYEGSLFAPAQPLDLVADPEAPGLAHLDKSHEIIVSELFEKCVERALKGPIFVLDYPASLCPLTKRKQSNPAVAERFELFVEGMEVANAYTELNDPDLQQDLFRKQLAGQREEDSMAKMDDDFIRALQHGMPPAGGLGIGIDRLVMLLTNSQTIRDVILFPLLRHEA